MGRMAPWLNMERRRPADCFSESVEKSSLTTHVEISLSISELSLTSCIRPSTCAKDMLPETSVGLLGGGDGGELGSCWAGRLSRHHHIRAFSFGRYSVCYSMPCHPVAVPYCSGLEVKKIFFS